MSRFQLRNWRVRWRIGALVVIPTIAAVVLGGLRIDSARNTASVFSRVDQLATLGSDVNALVESVEDERDLAAGDVAARQSGGGTLATTIAAQLNSQYATTSNRAAVVEKAVGQIGSSYPAVARTDLSALVAELATLPSVRALVQTGMTALPVTAAYTQVVSVLLTFDNDLAAGSSSPQLAQTVSSFRDVAQLSDEVSQQRAILYAELIQQQFEIGGLQELINAQSAQSSNLAEFQSVGQNLPAYSPSSGLSPTLTEVQQFNTAVSGPGIDAARAIEQNALISGNNGEPPIQPNGGPQAWFSDMTQELGTLRGFESDLLASSVAQAASLQQSSVGSEKLTAVIVLIVLLLVLGATILVARSMIVPLRRLRADALDVAGRRLPDVVRRLSESRDAVNDVEVEPIGINSADEIGEVARAFDQVHREAVRLAGDEAMFRANLNAMFVNLSRRSQTLIERQLGIIDRLEQSEQDSDRLSSLFRLDHLATRMRRNSENLLVLAGHEAPRKWTQPVPLVDVLRAGISEIEQYERISLSVPPGVMVIGRVASDVVHLVAELVENATVFSPEDTRVLVTSQRLTSGGVLLNVTDAGLGIPDQDLAYANWRLDNPPVVDVAVSRRMGLFVVGRLAARHGIRVRLQHARDGGLTALVWLPETLAEGETARPVNPLRQRFEPDAPIPGPRETPPVSAPQQLPSPPAPPAPTLWEQAQPAVSLPESEPRTTGTGGHRLPIFDSVESDWFRRGAPSVTADSSSVPTTPRPWTSPADDGFLAAQAAATPATGATTSAGLPKRVPSANLVPGRIERDQAPPPAAGAQRRPSPPPLPVRTAEEVQQAADATRQKLSRLQRGAREGRAAAPLADYENEEDRPK